MFKKFLTLNIFVALCLTFSPARAQSTGTQLALFPFEVNAGKELDYLQNSLPEFLAERLQEMGFSIVDQVQVETLIRKQGVRTLNLRSVRDLTLLSNSQFGVYGSFSQVGENISIDVRLVEAFGIKEPKAFYVVKQGMINLLPAIDELAELIRQEILREEKIATIEVKGNEILEEEVVLLRLTIQEGDLYDPRQINKELKRIYSLGYFDDVRVEVLDEKDGKRIVFNVKEKPLILAISVDGADAIDEEDIEKAMLTKTGSVINLKVLTDDIAKIREMYRQKGYYNAKVSYDLEQSDQRKARLVVTVNEGEKLYIEKISIEGAEQLDEDDLKDELALTERGLFSWFTKSGILKEELIIRDAAVLEAYYGNKGFIDAKVGQPDIEYKEDGIYITFKVVEGQRFKVGEVNFRGDILFDREKLLSLTKLDELAEDEEFFDRSVARSDSQRLADFYTNFGYAFAEANISFDRDDANQMLNVTYNIKKDRKVFIRRVLLEGNTKTRDNVLRREMRLGDGDLFSGAKLKRSNTRLLRLDYFSEVNIEPVPTESPNELDLKVKVKEKPTGMISAGFGYSTIENFFVSANITERNLFGKGYQLGISGTLGGSSTTYNINFWNPSIFNSRFGGGFDAYLTEEDWDDYDKDSIGGKLRTSFPIGEYSRIWLSYKLEQYTISNIEDDANEDIRDFEGDNLASAVTGSIIRDTTNRRFNPTKGTKNTISVEYSGADLGGDDNFIKYKYDSIFYYQLFWKLVFHWHGQIGYVEPNTENEIPPFERFYLGGINSIRGYEGREISPEDDDGNEIGGNKYFFTNVELIAPISEEIGLMGVVFFDAGDAWDETEDMELDVFKSVGAGLRWYSPLGPMRFEYGYPLDELDGDQSGKFEFTIGQFF